MKNETINFDIMFLPIDIISSWKRASISSSFCSHLLNTSHANKKYLENIISTVVNECLEFSIKHGVKKTENYTLSCKQTNEKTSIKLSLYLQSQQITLLKNYIKKIQVIKENNELETILFTKEFSELGYAIYSLIKDYKGKIKIEPIKKKEKPSSIIKTNIILNLNIKDIKNDYQN